MAQDSNSQDVSAQRNQTAEAFEAEGAVQDLLDDINELRAAAESLGCVEGKPEQTPEEARQEYRAAYERKREIEAKTMSKVHLARPDGKPKDYLED